MRRNYALSGVVLLAGLVLWGLWARRQGHDPERGSDKRAASQAGAARPNPGAGATEGAAQRLRGWVRDDAGAPVAGALVRSVAQTPTEAADAGTESKPPETRTDHAGAFSLLVPGACPCDIEVTAGHHAPMVARGVGPGAAAQLTLDRTATLTGSVRDAGGAAVADIEVEVAGSGLWPGRFTRTDPQGHFEIAGLPGGLYVARARTAEALARTALPAAIEPGAGADITLALRPAASLRGRVLDAAAGDPVPDATVSVGTAAGDFAPELLRTDTEGRFATLALAEGKHPVSVRAPGFVTDSGLRPAGAGEVAIRLRRGATLSGRVLSADGRPVAGADLEVVGRGRGERIQLGRAFGTVEGGAAAPAPRGGPVLATGNLGVVPGPVPPLPIVPGAVLPGADAPRAPEAAAAAATMFTTDAEGRFRIEGVPGGRVQLLARHPEHATGITPSLRLRDGQQREDLELTLGAGVTLQGIVLDTSDNPVAAARIALQRGVDPAPRSTFSDADGRFTLRHLSGDYTLELRAGPELELTRTLRLGARDVELELRLRGRHSVARGRVVDPRGFPLSGVLVRIEQGPEGAGVSRTTTTGADGTFEAVGLPEPPLRLLLRHPGFAAARAQYTSATGEELLLPLSVGQILRGRVRSADGVEPLSGVELRYRNRDGFDTGAGRTGPSGEFEFSDLNTGTYKVHASLAGHVESRAEVRVGDGSTPLELRLTGTGEIAGQVVDALGAPVYDAQVAVGTPPAWASAVRSDHAGEYLLGGLGPGAARVTARHPEGGSVRLELPTEVRTGQRAIAGVLRLPGRVRPPPALEPEAQPAAAEPRRGVAASVARRGDAIVVTAVVAGSRAAAAGLRVGDRIVSVEDETVYAAGQVRSMWRGEPGTRVHTRINRDSGERALLLTRERYTLAE